MSRAVFTIPSDHPSPSPWWISRSCSPWTWEYLRRVEKPGPWPQHLLHSAGLFRFHMTVSPIQVFLMLLVPPGALYFTPRLTVCVSICPHLFRGQDYCSSAALVFILYICLFKVVMKTTLSIYWPSAEPGLMWPTNI